MSRENIAAIRFLFEAFSAGGEAAARCLDVLAPDIEIQDYPGMPGATWNYGHQGAAAWAVKLFEVFGTFRLEPLELLEIGDRVVVPTRVVATGKRSGVSVALEATAVCTARDGIIHRLEVYETRSEALEAAVRPLPAQAPNTASPRRP
jgi:ketosteroid isomerase-like protein